MQRVDWHGQCIMHGKIVVCRVLSLRQVYSMHSNGRARTPPLCMQGALSLARRQARAAGVEDCISFTLGDAAPWRPSALDADTYTDIFTASSSSSSSKPTTTTTTTASAALPMLVVTNPPWGMRLGREEESAYPPQRSARERDRGRPAGGPKGIAALDEPTIMSWRALDQFLYHGCPGGVQRFNLLDASANRLFITGVRLCTWVMHLQAVRV